MAKNLVIVESPAKAKTIHKLLGKDYTAKASMGHVRDLPERALGVDVENHFAPQYVPIKGRAAVLKELKGLATKAEVVYLAPDPDREGEAIAWHLREALASANDAPEKFKRITYNEITASAIRKAFEHPGEINQNRVDSQQARRILDRVVGYKVSPMLWRRIQGASSAGRVQSVALRLVCERENAITAFQPEPYWILGVRAAKQVTPSAPFTLKLAKINGEKADVRDEARALQLAAELEKRALRVAHIILREVNKKAPPPFITSSLQQAASGALGFTPSRTMRIAQKLYEGIDIGHGTSTGLITYMRTDSFNIAREAQESARQFIEATHGAAFIPEKPNVYKSRSSAQEAHEAIRPTDPTRTPEQVKNVLERDEWRLYDLIWRRFMASQMSPAKIGQRTAEVEAIHGTSNDAFLFRATASEILFPGFMRVSGLEKRKKAEAEQNGDGEEVESLPELSEGEALDVVEWLNDKKETQPPPRFTEASLIKELEENGVGRPSTYAQIISTLLDRSYVEKDKKALRPTALGLKVSTFLVEHLSALFDVGFTADMEKQLDEIEEGSIKWDNMLEQFYQRFQKWLQEAKGPAADSADVERLLAYLANVQTWQAPVTRGKRTYSDEKFVQSVKEQFDEKKKDISSRQLDALKKMLLRYKDQIPGSAEAIKEYKIIETPEEAERRLPPRQETIRKLDLLNNVQFEPPHKFGKRTYDDKEFSASLRKQVEDGKRLSLNQITYLDKLMNKYAAQIPEFEKEMQSLGVSTEAEPAGGDTGVAGDMLALLEQVHTWRAPTTSRGRTWDDKVFAESLKQQHERGKAFSPRQMMALKRLLTGYAGQIADFAAHAEKYGLAMPKNKKEGESQPNT